MNLTVQFVTMGYMFGSGLILGVMYDIYRVALSRIRMPRWMIPILDFLYWIAATIIVFRLLYHSNLGQVRVFVFIAIAIGILFYFALLSRIVCKILQFIANMIVWFVRFVWKLITILIIRPSMVLYRILLVILGAIVTVFVFIGKVMLQLLYPVRLLGRLLKLDKLINGLKRYF